MSVDIQRECGHPNFLRFKSGETFPEHTDIGWCTCCGVLFDEETGNVIAGPSDYRERWINSDLKARVKGRPSVSGEVPPLVARHCRNPADGCGIRLSADGRSGGGRCSCVCQVCAEARRCA